MPYASPAQAAVYLFDRSNPSTLNVDESIDYLNWLGNFDREDLNGDGRFECVASLPVVILTDGRKIRPAGASGNTSWFLLRETDRGWELLNEFGGNDYHILDTRTRG